MQFAELEAALLAQQPEFKTILRQIHRHLGQEPELVTKMTEQEIQLIVSGLVVFANAEIVAPAVAKSTKAKIAAAKKVPISADDL
jgi:TolA C-terminal.